MKKNPKKSYQQKVHDLFVKFGRESNTARLEHAIVSLINEIVVESIMDERTGLLKEILDELKEVEKELKESNKGKV